jgi:hypothetical protein
MILFGVQPESKALLPQEREQRAFLFPSLQKARFLQVVNKKALALCAKAFDL